MQVAQVAPSATAANNRQSATITISFIMLQGRERSDCVRPTTKENCEHPCQREGKRRRKKKKGKGRKGNTARAHGRSSARHDDASPFHPPSMSSDAHPPIVSKNIRRQRGETALVSHFRIDSDQQSGLPLRPLKEYSGVQILKTARVQPLLFSPTLRVRHAHDGEHPGALSATRSGRLHHILGFRSALGEL